MATTSEVILDRPEDVPRSLKFGCFSGTPMTDGAVNSKIDWHHFGPQSLAFCLRINLSAQNAFLPRSL